MTHIPEAAMAAAMKMLQSRGVDIAQLDLALAIYVYENYEGIAEMRQREACRQVLLDAANRVYMRAHQHLMTSGEDEKSREVSRIQYREADECSWVVRSLIEVTHVEPETKP